MPDRCAAGPAWVSVGKSSFKKPRRERRKKLISPPPLFLIGVAASPLPPFGKDVRLASSSSRDSGEVACSAFLAPAHTIVRFGAWRVGRLQLAGGFCDIPKAGRGCVFVKWRPGPRDRERSLLPDRSILSRVSLAFQYFSGHKVHNLSQPRLRYSRGYLAAAGSRGRVGSLFLSSCRWCTWVGFSRRRR